MNVEEDDADDEKGFEFNRSPGRYLYPNRPSSTALISSHPLLLSSAAISTISLSHFLDAAHRHDTRYVLDNNSGLDQKTMPVMLLIHSVPFKAGRQKHARRKLESNV